MISWLSNVFKKTLNSDIKKVLLIYLGLVTIKIFLSLPNYIPTPLVYGDELLYAKAAESFLKYGEFSFQGNLSHAYPPLYSIVISVAYIFNDPFISYKIIKIINAFLSSLIVFPVWLLCKEFFNNKESLYVVLLISVIPFNFSFPFTVMSENLFIPVFLFTVFLMLNSILNNSLKMDLLCGLAFGVCYLTRIIGIVLIPTYIIVLVFNRFFESYRQSAIAEKRPPMTFIVKPILTAIVKKWAVFLAFGLTIMPWLIRNATVFSLSLKGLFGYTSIFSRIQKTSVMPLTDLLRELIIENILHLNYFVLSLHIILFVFVLFLVIKLNKQKSEEQKKLFVFIGLSFTLLILLLLLTAYHTAIFDLINPDVFDYLRGRYLDPIVPLFIILAFVGIKEYKKSKRNLSKITLLTLLCCFIAIILSPIRLLSPLNSIGINYLGRLTIPEFRLILIFIVILIAIVAFRNFINFRNILIVCAILFIISSYFAFMCISWSSNVQFSEDQKPIAEWINKIGANETDTFIIDDSGIRSGYLSGALSFFTDAKFKCGKVTPNSNWCADYYISSSKSDWPYLSKKFQTNQYVIYEINNQLLKEYRTIHIGADGMHPVEVPFTLPTYPEEYLWLEAESFSGFTSHERGWGKSSVGYKPCSNGMALSGAHAPAGESLIKAFSTTFDEEYNIWIRSRIFNFDSSDYILSIDNNFSHRIFHDKAELNSWQWLCIENCSLSSGHHIVSLTTTGKGDWAGIDLILITNSLTYTPGDCLMPIQQINTKGKPTYSVSYKAAYYLWQDDELGWHIRWTSSDKHISVGEIICEEEIENITKYSFEKEDYFMVSNNSISFNATTVRNEKGFGFVTESKSVTFDVRHLY